VYLYKTRGRTVPILEVRGQTEKLQKEDLPSAALVTTLTPLLKESPVVGAGSE
jgi:hypothetical protein